MSSTPDDSSSSTDGCIVVVSETLRKKSFLECMRLCLFPRYRLNWKIIQIQTYISSVAAGPRKNRETKNGIIASTSMIFIPSFRNLIFSGAPASLRKERLELSKPCLIDLIKYSSVNQAIETVSTIASPGFSTSFPWASWLVC